MLLLSVLLPLATAMPTQDLLRCRVNHHYSNTIPQGRSGDLSTGDQIRTIIRSVPQTLIFTKDNGTPSPTVIIKTYTEVVTAQPSDSIMGDQTDAITVTKTVPSVLTIYHTSPTQTVTVTDKNQETYVSTYVSTSEQILTTFVPQTVVIPVTSIVPITTVITDTLTLTHSQTSVITSVQTIPQTIVTTKINDVTAVSTLMTTSTQVYTTVIQQTVTSIYSVTATILPTTTPNPNCTEPHCRFPIISGIVKGVGSAVGGVAKGVGSAVGGMAKAVGPVIGGIAQGAVNITGEIVTDLGGPKQVAKDVAAIAVGGLAVAGVVGVAAAGLGVLGVALLIGIDPIILDMDHDGNISAGYIDNPIVTWCRHNRYCNQW
jgi:hypothetical protein